MSLFITVLTAAARQSNEELIGWLTERVLDIWNILDVHLFAEAAFQNMGRDHRSQAEKACIGWNHVWMEETDTQGCKLGDWAERVDSTTYRCKWCNKVGGQCHMVCYNSRKIDWVTLLEIISQC